MIFRLFKYLVIGITFFISACNSDTTVEKNHTAMQGLQNESEMEQNVVTYCTKKSTKRGELDEGNYNYCIKKERNAYYALNGFLDETQNMPDGKEKSMRVAFLQDGRLLEYLLRKNTKKEITNFREVKYELINRQWDAFQTSQYELQQNASFKTAYSKCVDLWDRKKSGVAFVDWAMADGCFRDSYE